MEFSIVIPVYNEAGNTVALLAEIAAVLHDAGNYEVIVVDDGSTDATAAELRAAVSTFPAVLRILRHRQRCGQSSALLSGVAAARTDWIVTLDGDGQNDPADIPDLLGCLHALGGGADRAVIGHRTRRRDSRVRRWSSRIANAVRGRLLRDATPDTGCGLKVFPRRLFLSLPAFDHMHRFLPALMLRQGARVVSVPVRHRPRRHGASKYGIGNRLWVGLVDIAGVMWLQRRRIGQAAGPDSVLSRWGDGLGVMWLQRRTCRAVVKEEF
jgi:dolichol-phosphate mannosyltransferase